MALLGFEAFECMTSTLEKTLLLSETGSEMQGSRPVVLGFGYSSPSKKSWTVMHAIKSRSFGQGQHDLLLIEL